MARVYLLLLLTFLYTTLLAKEVAGVSDEVYQSRIASMSSNIELTWHPSVRPFIEEYLNNPEKLRELIGRSKYYFPLLEKSLKAKGLPIGLKYLAATASELNPSAVSPNGASGLWLMAYPVSKMYKLKVNTYIDERRDPVKASLVAAQHFKDLYSIYKSWPLVIASYGCSPVTLNKCIHMSGNSLYFWDIYPHMPSFCKDLYPKVVATAYILNFYKEHGISTSEPKFEQESDSFQVNKWLSFQQISSVTGAPLTELRELNPVFRKDIIPFNAEGYVVRIPRSKYKNIAYLKDSVYRPINQAELLQADPIAKLKDEIVDSITNTNKTSQPKEFSKKKVTYTVKKGETLALVADYFDVSQAQIKSWNKLKSTKLKYGQKLVFWVEGNKLGYYKKINTMSAAQKKKIKNKDK
jgi:membrane-bound lytic murein transglycosylase D